MKVICDVCGTTFPETATHCPICGCAKSSAAQTVAGDDAYANAEGTTANTYARGGRFAKSNVKRNSRSRASDGRYSGSRSRQSESQESNKGLIAVVIILLLAIIMVVVYIGVNVFFNNAGTNPDADGGNQNIGGQQQTTGSSNNQSVPCTSVKLGYKYHEFSEASAQLQLSFEREPANTTDVVTFTSSDPEIAAVDKDGIVTPGTKQGTATITVTCGTVFDQCTIVSTVGEAPVTPDPIVPEVNIPDGFVLKLQTYKDSGEITIGGEGASHQLYKETMGVKASDITWTTSDEAVAIVENGKVIGVDRGTCTITAAIGDQVATCFVRCSFDKAPETPYVLNHTDVTLYAGGGSGSFFSLELKDKETGAKVAVEWKASKEGVVEISDTGKVTACDVTSSQYITVSAEYEGVVYTCKVNVHPPKD